MADERAKVKEKMQCFWMKKKCFRWYDSYGNGRQVWQWTVLHPAGSSAMPTLSSQQLLVKISPHSKQFWREFAQTLQILRMNLVAMQSMWPRRAERKKSWNGWSRSARLMWRLKIRSLDGRLCIEVYFMASWLAPKFYFRYYCPIHYRIWGCL